MLARIWRERCSHGLLFTSLLQNRTIWEEPRLGPLLLSGVPNTVPPEMLLYVNAINHAPCHTDVLCQYRTSCATPHGCHAKEALKSSSSVVCTAGRDQFLFLIKRT